MINLKKDNWLSKIFNYDVFELILNESVYDDLRFYKDVGYYLEKTPVFIYSKIPTDEIRNIHKLEAFGFRLVDTSINFKKHIVTDNMLGGLTNIRFAESEDEEEVCKLAFDNFSYSRFHLDFRIDNTIANTIKDNWVRNYFLGLRGDMMVVSHIVNKIVGFLLISFSDNIANIELIAVDKNNRRKQISSDMIKFVKNNITGFEYIKVSTQIVNEPSIKLYEKLGFVIDGFTYVFHYHNELI